MYENFSEEAKKILNRCHNLATNDNEYTVGTDHLLLSLFQERNSSCNILLKELNVTEDLIKDTMKDIILFRKSIPGIVIYTQSLKQILEKAVSLKILTKSNLVYEEHLFYSLLETRNCISTIILERLDIEIEDIQDEIIEVMDWDIEVSPESQTKESLTEFSFVDNLTESIKKKPLPPLVLRDEIIERIKNIINKKYKRNVLLIGNAGVGKTAIVEGLAKHFVDIKKDKQIISLNVNSLVSGTKYRGDFEKRIELFMNEIKNKSNVILFIDEIHNVINQNNLDAGVDLANIIKPALSRDEVCCIGATTLDEYHRYLYKDSAFTRRFVNIFVDEPSLSDTMVILEQIKSYYEDYHEISVTSDIIEYLCHVSDKLVKNNHFPDKAIDLLDESCAYCRNIGQTTLIKEHINHIINQINNNKVSDIVMKKIELYPYLKRNFIRYYNVNKYDHKPITSVLCKDISEDQLTQYIDDIQVIFNIKKEATKIIDLNNYGESHSISNLLGAPPGYVGYDNDNILSKFVKKYQKSLIVFKNLEDISLNIKNIIKEIIDSGYVEDMSSNKVYFSNSIIIGTMHSNKKSIGYITDQEVKKNDQEINFEHIIQDFHLNQPSIEESIDYRVVFSNYLSYLNQLDIDLIFLNEDELDLDHLSIKTIKSFEDLICDLWLNENNRKKFKVEYNKEKEQFNLVT